jgi:hypothetical protein
MNRVSLRDVVAATGAFVAFTSAASSDFTGFQLVNVTDSGIVTNAPDGSPLNPNSQLVLRLYATFDNPNNFVVNAFNAAVLASVNFYHNAPFGTP